MHAHVAVTVAVGSATGSSKGPGVPQGAAWAYDWRLGEDQAFVAACVAHGVEYVPMIVSAPLSASPTLAAIAMRKPVRSSRLDKH